MSESNMSAEPSAPVAVRRGPKPWVVYLFLALSIGCVIAAYVIPLPKRAERTPTTEVAAPQSYFEAPQFLLTDRSGAEVSTSDLRGKVWIASFVFTRCTMGCPQVTATMQALQTDLDLANADDLRLVTFTVDPENDSLDKLKAYAEAFKAHPTKWLFLTGKEKAVRPLLQEGFKITANKRANAKPGDEFDHSTKLFVMDKKGLVRGTFDGMQGEHDTDGSRYRASLVRLKEVVAELRKE
jgi:protein SCO1/2